MRRILFILVALMIPQLVHATEEEMLKKYLKNKKGVEATKGFKTPEIYNKVSPKPAGKKGPTTADAGRVSLFGHDLFNAPSEEFFLPSEAPVPESYALGPGDHIIINLWGRVEKTYNLIIDREGKVFIPKAGEITVWGLTIKQAEEKITKVLSKIYSDFQLSAVLGKIKSIKVFVYGEVKKPGAYTVSSLSTMFNVLYLCGGPNGRGALRSIRLFRNGHKIKEIDLYDLLLHGRNSDVRLANNDVIFVPVVARTATITGSVKRPAIYELKGGERVRDLIDLAGGLNSDAYLGRVLLERIDSNRKRVVMDLNLDAEDDMKDNVLLRDGDKLRVFSIYNYKEGIVELKGTVKYPGVYEFKKGMRISDLLDHGNQLVIESYLERANLIRTFPDLTKEIYAVNLRAVLAGDSAADFPLEARDRLVVYDRNKVRRMPRVFIEGQVLKEGSYELTKNMRLSDLVFLAGGLQKSAYLLYAEVARVQSGEPSKIIRTNLKECLEKPGGEADLYLKEDDRIFIREIPEWRLHELVVIDGEVEFPGRYALTKKHEKLSELIERAGGFTDRAFLRGAVFERSSIAEDIKRQRLDAIMENLQEVTADTVVQKIQEKKLNAVRTNEVTRILVDLEALYYGKDKSQDVELRGGDRIYIPQIPSGVHVLGAVAASGTITFVPGKNYKYYVKQAGGMVKSADKEEIRIVKPDGKVYKKRLSRVKIELGDSIVIPKKVIKDRQWLKIFRESFTILSGALTTVYVLSRL